MMKVAAILCLLAFAAPVFGRELEQFSTTSCSVFGSLSIVAKIGTCKGWAGASCTAHAKAQESIDSAFDAALSEDLCVPAVAEATAAAAAKAIVSVYVSSLSKVTCDGKGFGCGFAIADGSGFATGYAEAFAFAVAQAWEGNNDALCIADVKAIAVVLAEAAAEAQTLACVFGTGSATSFEEEFIKRVSTAFAKVIAFASAKICKKTTECGADVFASSLSTTEETKIPGDDEGQDSTSGTGAIFGGSGSSSAGKQLPPCEGRQATCCFFKKCDPFWLLDTPINSAKKLVLYKKERGVNTAKCFCY